MPVRFLRGRFGFHVFNAAIMIAYNVPILMPVAHSTHLHEVAAHRDCLAHGKLYKKIYHVRIEEVALLEDEQRLGMAGSDFLLDLPESFELADGVVVAAAAVELVALVAQRKVAGQNVARVRLNHDGVVRQVAVLGVKPEIKFKTNHEFMQPWLENKAHQT